MGIDIALIILISTGAATLTLFITALAFVAICAIEDAIVAIKIQHGILSTEEKPKNCRYCDYWSRSSECCCCCWKAEPKERV